VPGKQRLPGTSLFASEQRLRGISITRGNLPTGFFMIDERAKRGGQSWAEACEVFKKRGREKVKK
jgi:hypothetical protein